jgi:hypothetical protein
VATDGGDTGADSGQVVPRTPVADGLQRNVARESKVRWRDNHRELSATLVEVEQAGVKWRNTRFDDYLGRLRQLGEVASVPSMSVDRESELMWEAVNQGLLLRMSRSAWAGPDPASQALLKTAMKGATMTPSGTRNDAGRNALLELLMIALLRDAGADVRTDPKGADATVTLPGGVSFVMECKRPASERSFADNVDDVRGQIEGRNHDCGLAVIGTDRVLDYRGAVPVDAVGAHHLCNTLLEPFERIAIRRFRAAQGRTRLALALVHTGSVYVLYPESAPFTFVHIGACAVGDGVGHITDTLSNAVEKAALEAGR